jgi:hypothetical protein
MRLCVARRQLKDADSASTLCQSSTRNGGFEIRPVLIALAEPGFAWRSHSAGEFGEAEHSEGVARRVAGAECEANPPRVPMLIIQRVGDVFD